MIGLAGTVFAAAVVIVIGGLIFLHVMTRGFPPMPPRRKHQQWKRHRR